ncbi:hypothetical protein ACIPF8_07830 [Collimonas sp. NPDC087041]|uniref:hypothetical protein n=1 Tax=Collimonas sp. NPDC087041 TaxID=3363960 RepID=UPI0037F7426A
MHIIHQKTVVSQLTKVASLLILGALSACGGGGDNGSSTTSTGTAAPVVAPVTAPAVTPVVNTLPFKRMGFDFSTTGITQGTDLGATIDASANMTFAHQSAGSQDTGPNINFTLPSGLPGGSVVASNLFSINNVAADKNIRILSPNATKFVQNVAWRNSDDPTVVGFDLAGYVTDLTAVTWPAAGTATYTGTAFQYTIESTNPPGPVINARALYSSNVVATVDYAAQKITIVVAGNPVLIESSGTPSVVDPSKFASTLTYTNVNYAALLSGFDSGPLTSGLGLGGGSNMLRFFGPNAEEFGAVLQFGGYLNSNLATQFIALALHKQ